MGSYVSCQNLKWIFVILHGDFMYLMSGLPSKFKWVYNLQFRERCASLEYIFLNI
jgi:hypothetical protein